MAGTAGPSPKLADIVAHVEPRRAAHSVIQNLNDGLSLLRDLCFKRIHEDVEATFGLDSMIMPVSPQKSERRSKTEIELFQIAEATCYAQEQALVEDVAAFWLALTNLRLHDAARDPAIIGRITKYLELGEDDRRTVFCRILQQGFPEAARVPVVFYRLFPLAARIATAVAFGRGLDAAELRSHQCALLPAISDCVDCHGRPLENGEACATCGNPVWRFRWLMSTD